MSIIINFKKRTYRNSNTRGKSNAYKGLNAHRSLTKCESLIEPLLNQPLLKQSLLNKNVATFAKSFAKQISIKQVSIIALALAVCLSSPALATAQADGRAVQAGQVAFASQATQTGQAIPANQPIQYDQAVFAGQEINTGQAAQQTLQAVPNPPSSLFDIIYESSTSYPITAGATYENIKRFTSEGWLNINVIRVDTGNPYIKLDSLVNPESIQVLTSVPDLARFKNAAGAINGSFFNWSRIPGLNSPIGPMVESGTIKTAASDFNKYGNSMATFAMDKEGRLLYEFWKTDIKLVNQDGTAIPIARYNTQLNNNGELTLYDRNWATMSIGRPVDTSDTANTVDTGDTWDTGSTTKDANIYDANTYRDIYADAFTDIIEMVVHGNTVIDIRHNLPPVEIPQEGYIVVAANNNTKLISDNFKAGDTVFTEIVTSPDWNNISMAISGGAIILKDGVIPSSFSHNSPGRHPRTAIGSTRDEKQVIMVTVDGRQQGSLGITLPELAYLMLELGAYNAINLDGGGSATMAVRKPGTNIIEVVNNPSDGMPRKVGNAAGVISTAPKSSLAGLIIDTEDKNVFVNTTRSYTIRGYDMYFNPVEVDPASVKWSVSGIEGNFEGNVFRPTSVGSGKIIASIGEITAEHEVNSLSSPVQLILNEKMVSIQVNGKQKFTVTGKNKNGYYAKINPGDVQWTVYGDIGNFEGDTFTATAEGTGYIEAAVGNTKAYCGVMAARDAVIVIDDFEKPNGAYLSYPENIPGSYELSAEQKRSGSYSGKLTYDFSDSTGSRASYLLFSDGGYKLDKNVHGIGLWIYNTNPNPNWFRALVYDSAGGRHFIDFTQKMDWTGWKYVEADISAIESKPLTLARLYIVQIQDVPDAGSVYLDDLTIICAPDMPGEHIEIPGDTIPVDEANRPIVYEEGQDSLRFAVFSQSSRITTPLERLLLLRLSTRINGYMDAAVFMGKNSGEAAEKVGRPHLTVYTGFRSMDVKNSRFIQLDTTKGGLRQGSSEQWKWFLNQMESFNGDNIFIFMDVPPGSFSDNLEAGLFQDILTEYRQKTGKNIWVFYKGNENSSYMERGIKYLSCAGLDIEGLDPSNTGLVQYINVVVKGKEVTFRFVPVTE
ncbi:MAG: phosphodiester glycosidase family protein [Clostridiaceae bacterium]|nr:phosphodiester glycosidase family protein [Clostridiaceae bacterium]